MDGVVSETRKRLGLRISELARRARVSRQTIYDLEAGRAVRSIETLVKVAQALEIKLDDFAPDTAARLRSVLR